MSDAEKQVEVQEEAPKKRPYNLREKKDKKAAFIVVECKAENVKIRVEDY